MVVQHVDETPGGSPSLHLQSYRAHTHTKNTLVPLSISLFLGPPFPLLPPSCCRRPSRAEGFRHDGSRRITRTGRAAHYLPRALALCCLCPCMWAEAAAAARRLPPSSSSIIHSHMRAGLGPLLLSFSGSSSSSVSLILWFATSSQLIVVVAKHVCHGGRHSLPPPSRCLSPAYTWGPKGE